MTRKKNEQKKDKKRTLVFKTKKGIKRQIPQSATDEQNSLESTEKNIPIDTESNNVEGDIDES